MSHSRPTPYTPISPTPTQSFFCRGNKKTSTATNTVLGLATIIIPQTEGKGWGSETVRGFRSTQKTTSSSANRGAPTIIFKWTISRERNTKGEENEGGETRFRGGGARGLWEQTTHSTLWVGWGGRTKADTHCVEY